MLDDRHSHGDKFYGKHSGQVTDNQDTDFFGRIKVKVPSIFGNDVEVRARPCFTYGHFFVPPVGAHVWVEFEAGDTRYPLWVGTWYAQGETPAEASISPPDNRVVQTASGHTIEIMDKAGEEKITIKHKGKAFVNIDKNGSILVANQTGSYLQLDADGQSATVMEQHGNIISMDSQGVVVTQKSGASWIQMTDDAVLVAGKSIILQAPVVSITGDPTAQPTILGTTFGAQFTPFALHTHASAVGPTGPPIPPGPMLTPGSPMLSSGTVVK